MHFLRTPDYRAVIRIAYFVGILGTLALAAREMCLFHASRAIFHVLVEVTTFLMLAYVWGKLLKGLWSLCSRISGCERKSPPSSSAARRRLRTTPFVRASRRVYGHNA